MVQHSAIDHSGLASVSYASNSNTVAAAGAAGASTLVSRADHVHYGVTSVTHTSNTFAGPVTLVAQGTLGITSPSSGTFALNSTGAAAAGSTSRYFSRRLWAQDPGNASATFALNSTSYVSIGSVLFYHDWDAFPATQFRISAYGFASESGETVTAQFATSAAPATPYGTIGNDLTIPFNGGVVQAVDSGWRAMASSPTGIVLVTVALKGSNTTVDFTGRWLDISLRIL